MNEKPPEAQIPEGDHGGPPKPLKIQLAYPWLSPLCCMALIAVFVFLQHSPLLERYGGASLLTTGPVLGTAAALVTVLLIFDLRRFYFQKNLMQKRIERLEQELQYAWQSRRKLQQKSHIYSDHADKLKRFISDKLLEQIEYDEKFLHFKSIAAEIRHNCVISYDIVRSALEDAIRKQAPASDTTPSSAPGTEPPAGESTAATSAHNPLADTHRFGLPNNPNSGSQQALQAMKYLWDLLDLSTADNIALHIGNYLIECEELYYQMELNKPQQESYPPGEQPVFAPSYATIKAMGPYLQTEQMDQLIARVEQTRPGLNAPLGYCENNQFRICLNPTDHLLGNENHIILLLENLVKNAQFFTTKTRFKQKTDRIALLLQQGQGCVHFVIYNRGPHIKEQDKEQIFHLGFSTRRVKEHHGKGLGLFFVNEIVKGYQGKIEIDNINNREHTYTVRIALRGSEVVTKVIECRMQEQKPRFRELGQQELNDSLQWSFKRAIESVEVSSTADTKTHVFNDFNDGDNLSLLDPENPYTPEWLLELNAHSKQWQLKFAPLDIKGALFRVTLPTAEARLNGEELKLDETLSQEVDKLDEQFNQQQR